MCIHACVKATSGLGTSISNSSVREFGSNAPIMLSNAKFFQATFGLPIPNSEEPSKRLVPREVRILFLHFFAELGLKPFQLLSKNS